MKKKLKISIVIVNYKTYIDLAKCLKALDKQEKKSLYNIQTILVDCAYQQKEVNKLRKKYPGMEFILQDDSYGLSANLNRGFKRALELESDYVLMVTPDVYLQKNVLNTFVERLNNDKNLGAVTCKTLLPLKPPRIYFVGGVLDPVSYTSGHTGYFEEDRGQYNSLKQTDFLNCALVMMRAEAFNKIGFWDTQYYLMYEDIDWTVRLKKYGYKIEVLQNVFAWHDESSTIGRKSMQQEYYLARNHLLFVKKNASLKNKILAYLFVTKETLKLLPKLFDLQERKRFKYILLGRVDFLLGRCGQRIVTE